MTRESCKWLSKWPGDGGQLGLSRRALLASAFAPLVRGQKAEVSEFDFSLLEGRLTPNDLFFVREHFPAPRVSTAAWRLAVGGAVGAGFEISHEELLALPRKSLEVTIECAENGVS